MNLLLLCTAMLAVSANAFGIFNNFFKHAQERHSHEEHKDAGNESGHSAEYGVCSGFICPRHHFDPSSKPYTCVRRPADCPCYRGFVDCMLGDAKVCIPEGSSCARLRNQLK